MADPMPPHAPAHSLRAQSVASSRREDSLANDQQSPDDSTAAAAAAAEQNKKHLPTLDWSKFKANFIVKHHRFPSETERPTKKRKRTRARQPTLEENAFEKSLNTLYTVEPGNWWDDARKYRKFTISPESFRVGDCVFVRPDEFEASDGPLESWVAKVLEVRAASQALVFLRILWLYRPEDLPHGRRPYHGRNEVIASNRMQIIDAQTVNGKANVKHWTEDDSDDVPDGDQLFWRQTLDYANKPAGGELSTLRKHCVDETPFNPDNILIHCDACDLWLHGECLEREAIKQAHAEKGFPKPRLALPSQEPVAFKKAAKNGTAASRSSSEDLEDEKIEPAFTAELKTDAGGKSRIIVRDTREEQQGEEVEKEIHCLKCSALIE